MSRDIEQKISNCNACLKFQRSNQKEVLIPSEIPNEPWKELDSDLFYFGRKPYILIVVYFSKYVEVMPLKDETSCTTIKAIKSCFARWGIPEVSRSDNG